MTDQSLQTAIADLPDEALVPVGWVRERIESDGGVLPYITVNEAAELLGKSPATACSWCRLGRLKATKVGRGWQIQQPN